MRSYSLYSVMEGFPAIARPAEVQVRGQPLNLMFLIGSFPVSITASSNAITLDIELISFRFWAKIFKINISTEIAQQIRPRQNPANPANLTFDLGLISVSLSVRRNKISIEFESIGFQLWSKVIKITSSIQIFE